LLGLFNVKITKTKKILFLQKSLKPFRKEALEKLLALAPDPPLS